ncbi:MAG: hypothetical protein M1838_004494 [Thelocarpon superellum]|nr:MAG: hypothetical protein M1838_004494 [Thelocarpon superellum]
MKILTLNFLTCAVKRCKASPQAFPLHCKDAELEHQELDFNPAFLYNILPRVEWDALRVTAAELGITNLPVTKPASPLLPNPAEREPPSTDDEMQLEHAADESTEKASDGTTENQGESKNGETADDGVWKDLHTLLLETQVTEGKLVCGNCGHEYNVHQGIANFLLPNHLV